MAGDAFRLGQDGGRRQFVIHVAPVGAVPAETPPLGATPVRKLACGRRLGFDAGQDGTCVLAARAGRTDGRPGCRGSRPGGIARRREGRLAPLAGRGLYGLEARFHTLGPACAMSVRLGEGRIRIAVEPGCAWRGRFPIGLPPSPEQPLHGRLRAEPRVDGGPDRHERHSGFAVGVVLEGLPERLRNRHPIIGSRDIVVVFAGRRPEPETGRGRQGQDRHARKAQRHDHQRRLGSAEDMPRQRQHAVPDDAAQTARQRPAVGRRKRGGQSRGGDTAHEQQRRPEAGMVEPAPGQQAPTPADHRRQDRHDGDAGQLHDEVGRHGAGRSRKVADSARRRMVPARIVHRPGRQCQTDTGNAPEERRPAEFGDAAAEKLARGFRHEIDRHERRDSHGQPAV